MVKDLHAKCVLAGTNFFNNQVLEIHTNLVLVLGLKADFFLGIRLVLNLVQPWYEDTMTSGPYQVEWV